MRRTQPPPDNALEPPYRLCAIIAATALVGVAVVLWLRGEQTGRETAAISAMSMATGDLKQVIRLKEVYSKPLEPEDPSQYRQKSPSDRRPE